MKQISTSIIKTGVILNVCCLIFILLTSPAAAANPSSGLATSGFGDVNSMKKDALSIVDAITGGNYEAARRNFDDNLTKNLSAAQIKQVWDAVVAQIGLFKSHGDPYYAAVAGGSSVITRCQMERGAVTIEVYFNTNEKVAGLWVKPAQ